MYFAAKVLAAAKDDEPEWGQVKSTELIVEEEQLKVNVDAEAIAKIVRPFVTAFMGPSAVFVEALLDGLVGKSTTPALGDVEGTWDRKISTSRAATIAYDKDTGVLVSYKMKEHTSSKNCLSTCCNTDGHLNGLVVELNKMEPLNDAAEKICQGQVRRAANQMVEVLNNEIFFSKSKGPEPRRTILSYCF